MRAVPRARRPVRRAILVLTVLAAVLMTVSPMYADSKVEKDTLFYLTQDQLCVFGYSSLTVHPTNGADLGTLRAYTMLVAYASCRGNAPWPYKTEGVQQMAIREDLNYWYGSYFWPCQSIDLIYNSSPGYYMVVDANYVTRTCGPGYYQTSSYVYAHDKTIPYSGWIGGSLTSGYLYAQ